MLQFGDAEQKMLTGRAVQMTVNKFTSSNDKLRDMKTMAAGA